MSRSHNEDRVERVAVPELLRAMGAEASRAGLSGADGPVLSADAEARLQTWLRARVAQIPARRRQRLRRRVFGTTVLGLAAGLALTWLPGRSTSPSHPLAEKAPVAGPSGWQVSLSQGASVVWTDAEGSRHRLSRSGVLGSPNHIEADAKHGARITTPSGATLRLAPGGRVAMGQPEGGDNGRGERGRGADTELLLERGRVHVHVPKLGPRRSFSLRTPDARVIVHGTRFEVSRGNANGQRTCVRVQEGRVEVRRAGQTRFLGPGQSSGCPVADGASAPAKSVWRAPKGARGEARREVPRGRVKSGDVPPGSPSESALSAQNRLLSEALAAERREDVAAARRGFRRLLRRYPDSPLAPEARKGLARLAP